MKQLVKVKADVNVQDSKSGKTALHHCIENGDLPMSGYLVMEVRERREMEREGGERDIGGEG